MLSLSTENQNGTMTMHVLSFNSLAHFQLFLDKHTYLVKNLGLGKSDKAQNYKLVKRENGLSKASN